MLFEIEFATFAQYSPRGNNEFAQRSRRICDQIKNGSISQIELAIPHLLDPKSAVLHDFLNDKVSLVPIPRSAPVVEGGLWPTKVLAEILVKNGLGKEVLTCLIRKNAVPKSSLSYSAATRPTWQQHYDSFLVNKNLIPPEEITLIDDVFTLGRTSFASAQKIHDAFPQSKIRIFALMRTRGYKTIKSVVCPEVYQMHFNQISKDVDLPN